MSGIAALPRGGQCRRIEKAPWSNLDQKKGREGGLAELGAFGGTLSPGGAGQRRASAGRVFTAEGRACVLPSPVPTDSRVSSGAPGTALPLALVFF